MYFWFRKTVELSRIRDIRVRDIEIQLYIYITLLKVSDINNGVLRGNYMSLYYVSSCMLSTSIHTLYQKKCEIDGRQTNRPTYRPTELLLHIKFQPSSILTSCDSCSWPFQGVTPIFKKCQRFSFCLGFLRLIVFWNRILCMYAFFIKLCCITHFNADESQSWLILNHS